MKKWILLCIFIVIVIGLVFLIKDLFFDNVDVTVNDISFKPLSHSKTNMKEFYGITEDEYAMLGQGEPQVVSLTIKLNNTSVLKQYAAVRLEFLNTNNANLIVGQKFEMGGESGMISLSAHKERTVQGITTLVIGTDRDEQLKELSELDVVLTGVIFGNRVQISKPFRLSLN